MKARAWSAPSALLLAACLLILGCHDREAPHLEPTSGAALQQLSAKLGFAIPSGAEILGISDERGLDDATFAKLRLGSEDWSRFLAAAELSDGDFSEDRRYLLGPDTQWWDPSRPPSLRTAQKQLPNGEFLNVGVDPSGADGVRVYLMWHQT